MAAEAKEKRRENRPKIELNEIEPECRDESEFFIIFTNRRRIGNRREDNANQRPAGEKECRPAPVYLEGTHDDSPRLYQTRLQKSAVPNECRKWSQKRREPTGSRHD